MLNLPMHPAVVHLPLILAMLVPPLAVLVLWAIRAGKVPKTTWLLVVGLQALIVGGAMVALRTGESEEERIEDRIAEARIDAHERAAQQFTVVAGLTLALAAAAFVAGRIRPRAGAVAALATVAMSLVVAGLAVRTGHQGGELVYGPGGLAEAGAAGAGQGDEERDGDDEDRGAERDDERESFRERMDRDRDDDEDDDDERLTSVTRIHIGRSDHDEDRGDTDCDNDDD
jgi:uncharacterized membrane protein